MIEYVFDFTAYFVTNPSKIMGALGCTLKRLGQYCILINRANMKNPSSSGC